ncbi:dCTP deaminase [candidate division CPR3 bacterium GWF2_35_18]|uniref:dCTP deaminase n=1 Tax=candidate division CPR3 bacterium GW2011_GWF2_35_18 TaxID=1618350 RepID=A0A0G0BZL7_UNCC3|nr:MAG: Deoxycytidine triphosphate deaminase [candidate division CPR3 bacterium GW2011_GWF2_35_18]OGB62539.1 MAG: dCTP deaminase [candidate division CPR3 bacterium GWF2_35_18]OGB65790.1 MAG: dCTP deaminase [candidate division CPR3 bacterium RIFOXYA2_FULL_35_13]OGB79292.1 MAG: dCTP deaminase [candidate division CPR3 bacterium RIFOXYB2_FULL_35_8]
MILSDTDIKKAIKIGKIKVDPAPDYHSQLGSCSLDLKLGDTFKIFNHSSIACIDPKQKYDDGELMTEIKVKEGESFIIQPGDFVLAVTEENFEIADDLMARIEGRSSLGRMGIIIHSTAAVFNPGWRGKAVMEVGNLGRIPVKLYPGMRICALVFEELTSKAEVPYYKSKNAKYKNQSELVGSRISEEMKK